MFKKNTNEQMVNILLKENEKLKMENTRLRESLNEIEKYKQDYKSLISQLNDLKNKYIDALKEFNEIEDSYKAELNKLVSTTNKEN